jgi:hypothetical protein
VLRHALANISTAGPAPNANKWLVGFDRLLSNAPGSSATMTTPVPIGAVGRVDTFGNGVLYPGQYELALNNERSAVMSFTLTGNATYAYEMTSRSLLALLCKCEEERDQVTGLCDRSHSPRLLSLKSLC